MKRGWYGRVAPCCTGFPNIAAISQYCKVCHPVLSHSESAAVVSRLLHRLQEAVRTRPASSSTQRSTWSLKNRCLRRMAKSYMYCKTEETTYYFPCAKTPSHAGTAGEFTLHVAGRHGRLTLVLSHTESTGGLLPTQYMYMYVYFGRQLTPT